jgi:hypothetical protein
MNTRKCIAGLMLVALCAIRPVHAQLIIGSTVTASAGTFHYSYAISNGTAFDIPIITLSGLFPASNTVQNLTAPSGFLALFDPGLSLLSFFEDTQTFAVGTSSGVFTFDSPYAPGTGAFEAIDITGGFIIGPAVVPNAAPPMTAVPEPSTTAAIGSLLLIGLVLHRKFRPAKK